MLLLKAETTNFFHHFRQTPNIDNQVMKEQVLAVMCGPNVSK